MSSWNVTGHAEARDMDTLGQLPRCVLDLHSVYLWDSSLENPS